MAAKAWFLYLVRCSDGSLYTGITTNVPRRCQQHNAGTASRYTRSRRPVKLIYQESQASRSVALKRDCGGTSMSTNRGDGWLVYRFSQIGGQDNLQRLKGVVEEPSEHAKKKKAAWRDKESSLDHITQRPTCHKKRTNATPGKNRTIPLRKSRAFRSSDAVATTP